MQDFNHGGQPPYGGNQPPQQPPYGGQPRPQVPDPYSVGATGQQFTPPAAAAAYQPKSGPSAVLLGGLGALAVLLLVGAFLGGRFMAKAPEAEQRGYEAGAAAEKQRLLAEYQEGGVGYKRIYDSAFAAGQEEGEKKGTLTGEERGEKIGIRKGKQQQAKRDAVAKKRGEQATAKAAYQAAMGGYSDWAANGFYVTQFAPRAGADAKWVPTTITQHLQMKPGYVYTICDTAPNQICRYPAPPLVAADTANADAADGGAIVTE